MRRSLASLAALGAVLFAASAPSAAATDPALLVPIDRLIAAIDANDKAGIVGTYAAAPALVDEFPPFAWAGPGAAAVWFRDFGRLAKLAGLTGMHVSRGPALTANVAPGGGRRAYVVVPATFRYRVAGKTHREDSTWTFVLVERGAAWSIASSAWATRSDTLE